MPTEVSIIGSGIAALTSAEKLSMKKNVIIITKSAVEVSNSFYVQRGDRSSLSVKKAEIVNMLTVSRLITTSALKKRKSADITDQTIQQK